MKLKSWMEAHIVLRTKWKKKDKRKKKTNEKSAATPLQETTSSGSSLPSWRTSNFLHFFVTTASSGSRQQSKASRDKDEEIESRHHPSSNAVLPSAVVDVSSGNVRSTPQTPRLILDGNRLLGETSSVHTLHVHLSEQLDVGNLNSPRQRNKIRTNPWLTPKQQRSLPSSGSTGSDSGNNSCTWDPRSSCSSSADTWRSSCLSSTTAESLADSCCPSNSGRSDNDALDEVSEEEPVAARHPLMGDRKKLPKHAVHDSDDRKNLPKHAVRDSGWEEYQTLDEVSAKKPAVAKCPLISDRKKWPKRSSGGVADNDNDSDSEECETLNEMGNFDEHYEYGWEAVAETDILGDDGIGHPGRRRPSRRRAPASATAHQIPAAPRKWRDLRSDEDYSEKLDYADEAYSEMSGSTEDEAVLLPRNGFESGLSDGEDKDKRGRSPEADSAFPSDSELSSVATTPLVEGAASSSGSDSGIQAAAAQQHSACWSESGRSLRSIRDSLEDKVRHLRFERLVVEDKIREAKEEEDERRKEKERFRKELVSHRRQVLLRTLQELRLKLEDHGERLQEAYHSTLEMQLSDRWRLTAVAEENAVAAFCRMPVAAHHEKLL